MFRIHKIMRPCIGNHLVLLIGSMVFLFFYFVTDHVHNVYIFQQTRADPDPTLFDSYDDTRNNISIGLDADRMLINIETRTISRSFTKRRKRLSGSTDVDRQGDYLCFKTKNMLSCCVNITEDEDQNILLTLKIGKNVEDIEGATNITVDKNMTSKLNATIYPMDNREIQVPVVEIVEKNHHLIETTPDIDVKIKVSERKHENNTRIEEIKHENNTNIEELKCENITKNAEISDKTSKVMANKISNLINLNQRKLGFPIFARVALSNITTSSDIITVEKGNVVVREGLDRKMHETNDYNRNILPENKGKLYGDNKLMEEPSNSDRRIDEKVINEENINIHDEQILQKQRYFEDHDRNIFHEDKGKLYGDGKLMEEPSNSDRGIDEKVINEENINVHDEQILQKQRYFEDQDKHNMDMKNTNKENIRIQDEYIFKKPKYSVKLENDEVINEENVRDSDPYYTDIKPKYAVKLVENIDVVTNEENMSVKDRKILENLKYSADKDKLNNLMVFNEENRRTQTENMPNYYDDLDKNIVRYWNSKVEDIDVLQPITSDEKGNDQKQRIQKDRSYKTKLYERTTSEELNTLFEESMKEMEKMKRLNRKRPQNQQNILDSPSDADESFDEKYQILAFIKHDTGTTMRTTTEDGRIYSTEQSEQIEPINNETKKTKGMRKQMEEEIKDRLFHDWLQRVMHNLTQSNPKPDGSNPYKKKTQLSVGSYKQKKTKQVALENNKNRGSEGVPKYLSIFKPFRITQSSHQANPNLEIKKDRVFEDVKKAKSFQKSIGRIESKYLDMPDIRTDEIDEIGDTKDVPLEKHIIRKPNGKPQSSHSTMTEVETDFENPQSSHGTMAEVETDVGRDSNVMFNPIGKTQFKYRTKPSLNNQDQDYEEVLRPEIDQKPIGRTQAKFQTMPTREYLPGPTASGYDRVDENLSEDFVNLNQGYFRKSPQSWESFDSVYHIKQ